MSNEFFHTPTNDKKLLYKFQSFLTDIFHFKQTGAKDLKRLRALVHAGLG